LKRGRHERLEPAVGARAGVGLIQYLNADLRLRRERKRNHQARTERSDIH